MVCPLVEGHAGEDGEDEEDGVVQDPGHPLAPSVEADTLAENADNSGQVEERYQHHRGNHCGLVESQKRRILHINGLFQIKLFSDLRIKQK